MNLMLLRTLKNILKFYLSEMLINLLMLVNLPQHKIFKIEYKSTRKAFMHILGVI